jgi:hypothetical protein
MACAIQQPIVSIELLVAAHVEFVSSPDARLKRRGSNTIQPTVFRRFYRGRARIAKV